MDFQLVRSPHAIARMKAFEDAYAEALPHRYNNNEEYIRILNAFYKEESDRRLKNFEKIQSDPEHMKTVLMHISKRENILDFMVDWVWTYDPRQSSFGLPTVMPWLPWKQQVDFIEWVYNKYLNQKSGMVEKSRDQGATWLFCVIYLFEWRWTQGFAGGIGSNKLDNVDKKDEPDCIFEKIRVLMRFLPKFWFPEGFSPKLHDKKGNLVNPEMTSQIGGQGGKDIGRGGRRSMYFVDEAASLEFPKAADSSLSQNTNCQIDLSTPKGMNHFGQKRHSGKVDVFTFHWKNDPRKDQEWYDREVARLDPVVVAQEIDIDYHASVEGIFIKPEWINAAVAIKLSPNGVISAGLDVAAGGTNKSALYFRYGPVTKGEAFDISNGSDLAHKAIELCNKAGVEFLNYDVIGVGYAVKSTIERTEMKMNFTAYGLNGGHAPSDLFYEEFDKTGKEIFFNARAEWWYNLSRRFEKAYEHLHGIKKYPEEEMISIDNNGQLISELSAPKKFITETGKIKCESKQFMIKRGVQSPDEADAVAYAFASKAGGNKRIMDEMDFNADNQIEIDWSLPAHRTKHYGAIVINKDLSTHCIGAIWDQELEILSIYTEYRTEHPNPDKVAVNLIDRMKLKQYSADKIFGNKWMFQDGKKSFQKELNAAFLKYGNPLQFLKIREAKRYDPLGSTSVLMQLVKDRKIEIDSSCVEIKTQLFAWQLENNKFEHDGMREAILIIISELMGYTPFNQAVRKKQEYSQVLLEDTFDPSNNPDPMSI